MNWQFLLALAIAIPIIVFPAVLIWYLNIGGIFQRLKEARKSKVAVKTNRLAQLK